jgi:hypothetical protein
MQAAGRMPFLVSIDLYALEMGETFRTKYVRKTLSYNSLFPTAFVPYFSLISHISAPKNEALCYFPSLPPYKRCFIEGVTEKMAQRKLRDRDHGPRRDKRLPVLGQRHQL